MTQILDTKGIYNTVSHKTFKNRCVKNIYEKQTGIRDFLLPFQFYKRAKNENCGKGIHEALFWKGHILVFLTPSGWGVLP